MTAKEQKKNHDEMLSMIENLSNPTVRDVDYLEKVMGAKGFHPKQKIKLQKMLDKLRSDLPEEEKKNAITFAEDSTAGKRKAAEKVAKESKELASDNSVGESRSKIKVVNVANKDRDASIESMPTDRTGIFTQCQKELIEMSEKFLLLARKNRSISNRLTIVSRDLARHARNTLRI